MLSGSCAPSRIPSPAPSVAGSVTSSSGSLRYRRPLISPARLNLKGQKLLLFPSQNEALLTPTSSEEHSHSDSNIFATELSSFPKKNLSERGMHGMLAACCTLGNAFVGRSWLASKSMHHLGHIADENPLGKTQMVMTVRLPKLPYEFTGVEKLCSAKANVLFSLSGDKGILLSLPFPLLG